MELFFRLASPTTLASLIADIDQADKIDTSAEVLRRLCVDELEAIVGASESIEMMAAAGVGR